MSVAYVFTWALKLLGVGERAQIVNGRRQRTGADNENVGPADWLDPRLRAKLIGKGNYFQPIVIRNPSSIMPIPKKRL